MQTFDSDTAPSTIQDISISKATEAAKAEAKHLKEKEERRQWKKVRKEMKSVIEAGIIGDGEHFKGFQGSGGLAGRHCWSILVELVGAILWLCLCQVLIIGSVWKSGYETGKRP